MNEAKESNLLIVRTEKDRNYTTMSNYHLRDTRLSLGAIGLLSKILSLSENWNFSEAGFSSICLEGKDYIHHCIKELEELHYLEKRRVRNNSGRFSYEYIVYEIPPDESPLPSSPIPVRPPTVIPLTESPLSVKSQQINTNRLNTEKVNNKELITDYIPTERKVNHGIYNDYKWWKNS